MKGEILPITHKRAVEFLLPKHYSGRIPSISYAFGWFINMQLVAVFTFGKPASRTLCKGVCGDAHSSRVFELNRLCRKESLNLPLSFFVGKCLRTLSKENLIIVSYSDTAMNHNGYIYQACNFLYTGATKQRTDIFIEGNKHHRHASDKDNKLRKVRSSKHRYVYFAVKNKKLKKEIMNAFNYEIEKYPKGENKNYTLGEYLKPEYVDNTNI